MKKTSTLSLALMQLLVPMVGCGDAGTAPSDLPRGATDVPTPAIPSRAPIWYTPDGWQTETIPFPLEFAPEIAHSGVEELRLPPGFSKPGDDWFWSYAFVWHVAAPGPDGRIGLERELPLYFAGLAKAVGGVGREDIAAFHFSASLTGDLATDRGLMGTVEAFDAFETQRPVRLNVKIHEAPCASAGHRALVFRLSPREPARDDPVWRELDRLAGEFNCP